MSKPLRTILDSAAAQVQSTKRSMAALTWVWVFALMGCVASVYWNLVAWVLLAKQYDEIEDAFFEPGETSPRLIFALAILLFSTRIPAMRHAIHAGRSAPALGVPVLVAGAAAAIWAHYVMAPDFLIFSLICTLVGGAALLGGPHMARILLVPALFLLLAIPFPAAINNQLVYPLQLVTARLSARLLPLFGVQHFLIGEQLTTSKGAFQVIETCSSFRSIHTMVMASILYLEIFYRNRTQAVIILITAPLIAFGMNIVRVLTIVLNPLSKVVAIHTLQGIASLVIAVCLMHGLDRVLARFQGNSEPEPVRRPLGQSRGGPPWTARIAVLSVFAVAAGGQFLLEPWTPARRTPRPYIRLPEEMNGWEYRNLPIDKKFLGSVRYLDRTFREYTRNGEQVRIFVGLDDRLESNRSAISDKNALPGIGYVVEKRRALTPAPGLPEVEELVARSMDERRLIYYWTEGIASPWVEGLRALVHLDRGPLRRNEDVLVVRASTAIHGEVQDARRRLLEFVPLAVERLRIIEPKG